MEQRSNNEKTHKTFLLNTLSVSSPHCWIYKKWQMGRKPETCVTTKCLVWVLWQGHHISGGGDLLLSSCHSVRKGKGHWRKQAKKKHWYKSEIGFYPQFLEGSYHRQPVVSRAVPNSPNHLGMGMAGSCVRSMEHCKSQVSRWYQHPPCLHLPSNTLLDKGRNWNKAAGEWSLTS